MRGEMAEGTGEKGELERGERESESERKSEKEGVGWGNNNKIKKNRSKICLR